MGSPDVIDFVWYNGRWVGKVVGETMKETMLLGWTPAQWCTVLARYKPPTMDTKGLVHSRMRWQKDNLREPLPVDPQSKAAYHMGKFILRSLDSAKRQVV